MSKWIHILGLLCAISFVSGCHAARRYVVFDVATRNVGSVGLDNVRVEFEGFSHAMGFFGPHSGAYQYSMFEGRWPVTATVKWRFEDDRPYMPDHEAVVSIPPYPKPKPQEEVTLWFDLDGGRVTVRVETVDNSWIDEHIRKVEARARDKTK